MPHNLAERNRVIENPKLTIALPARNESANLEGLLPRLRLLCPEAEILEAQVLKTIVGGQIRYARP